MHIKSKAAFFISFLLLLIFPIFFPKIHLFYFAPYLVVCLYQYSKIAVLWRAFYCGILLDLFSSSPFFGFSSLKYCLVCWLLDRQTRHLFVDKLSTLPLMTYLFSFLFTILSLVLNLFLDNSLAFSTQWLVSDLILMPFADAIYAFLVFSLPFELIYNLRKLRLFKK